MKECNRNEEERFKYSLLFSLFFFEIFSLNIFPFGYGDVNRVVFSLTYDFIDVNPFALLELQIHILYWLTSLDMHAKLEIAN